MDILLLLLIFLFVTGLVAGVYWLIAQRNLRFQERLKQTGSDPGTESTPELVLGPLTPTLAGSLPVGSEDKIDLQKELREAGFYQSSALEEYAAIRYLLILLPLVAAGVLGFFFAETWAHFRNAIILGVIGAVLGYSMPRVYIYYRARRRKREIERGLPTAIDMMVLCLSAGLNIMTSLQRIAREVSMAYPTLGQELEIVRRQAELRTLEFAVLQFAERIDLPQLRTLAVILSQSESLGTDTGSTLREYADNLRVIMQQRADETANKAPFKLLFPAYLLAMGAAILLVSPAALEFNNFRKQNMVGNTIKDVKELLKPKQPGPNPTPNP